MGEALHVRDEGSPAQETVHHEHGITAGGESSWANQEQHMTDLANNHVQAMANRDFIKQDLLNLFERTEKQGGEQHEQIEALKQLASASQKMSDVQDQLAMAVALKNMLRGLDSGRTTKENNKNENGQEAIQNFEEARGGYVTAVGAYFNEFKGGMRPSVERGQGGIRGYLEAETAFVDTRQDLISHKFQLPAREPLGVYLGTLLDPRFASY